MIFFSLLFLNLFFFQFRFSILNCLIIELLIFFRLSYPNITARWQILHAILDGFGSIFWTFFLYIFFLFILSKLYELINSGQVNELSLFFRTLVWLWVSFMMEKKLGQPGCYTKHLYYMVFLYLQTRQLHVLCLEEDEGKGNYGMRRKWRKIK